ncbi:MAG: precorrin-6A reductase [Clostridiaceae bacterium]|nr:precorrin-6A reductase [Clostridiaceae bacterium]
MAISTDKNKFNQQNMRGKVLVVAGTVDGRTAVNKLRRAGIPIVVSVATEWAKSLLNLDDADVTVHVGRLDAIGFQTFMTSHNVSVVLDCTHPYAVIVSSILRKVTQELGVQYLRYTRPDSLARTDLFKEVKAYFVSDSIEACQIANQLLSNLPPNQTVFLTTGSKELPIYSSHIPTERLVARVLPVISSLEQCSRSHIKPNRIVAMQGPFDENLNKALFQQFNAGVIITKDGGSAGGFAEKIKAAADLDLPVIVIERPEEYATSDSRSDRQQDLSELVNQIIKEFQNKPLI